MTPDPKTPGQAPGWFARVFGRLTGKARRAEEQRTRSARLKLVYEVFREILAINDSTLQLISDIEDRLTGRVPFSLSLMSHRVDRAMMDAFVMVKDLTQISEGKYRSLFDALRLINAEVEKATLGRREAVVGPMVIKLDDLKASDAGLVGTKMANLGEVKNVIGLPVPDGFAVTTAGFTRFLERNDLWLRAERLEEVLETYGVRATTEACRDVQNLIIGSPLPAELEAAFLEAFDRLARDEPILVSVRSSGVGEDLAASHAGQYFTELNVDRGWLTDAYKNVLSSTFRFEPVSYRLEHGLTAADAMMAVGVMKMVKPKASGVMFSRGFDDPQADKIVISAARGLADVVVGGTVNAEEIVIENGRPVRFGEDSCCTDPDLEKLAEAARKIERHFGRPQDIEWAIDRDGELFILQCRQITTYACPDDSYTDIDIQGELLAKGGLTACPGIGSGRVFIARTEEDIDRFPEGGVCVAKHSSPKMSRIMTRCRAIVTERGSSIGHMAIIAREFGVPSIVGLENATAVLKDGEMVTVDATNARVYNGFTNILKEPVPEHCQPLSASPAVQKLKAIAQWVTPLNLIDPAAANFRPKNCRSLHDITRFVHEKVFEVMFQVGESVAHDQTSSYKLEGNLPYDVWVLDVGGGFTDEAGSSGLVQASEILSVPMKAFLEGFLDGSIKWDKPRAVSARGFMSVLGESMAGPPAEVQGVGKASFAIVSDRYMNFSTKAGYHFNTVDTYCGKSINKNYIHFRFAGGGAGEIRRSRRCRFIEKVLTALEFKVTIRGDLLVARLEKYDTEFIKSRLVELGRLTLCTRQMDMLMDTDNSPEIFASFFLAKEFHKF